MNPFVGYKSAPLSVDNLVELILEFKIENTYFFYRRTDSVSGIIQEAPTRSKFPMIEGQMFNYEYELRWKYKRENTYEVLLLTIGNKHNDFNILGKEWKIEPCNGEKFPSYAYPAYGYGSIQIHSDEPNSNKILYDENRFPKRFIYDNTLDIRYKGEKDNELKLTQLKLAQRYFLDKETNVVHFVALTIEK